MEKLFLEKPSIERKKDVLEFLKEFVENNSELYGSKGLIKCTTYEEWLDDVNKSIDKTYTESKYEVPSSTYFVVREEDNEIVGIVNIRHYLDRILNQIGGHIGGSIRPSERGKGYSEVLLYLALLECNKLGLKDIMIDCTKENIRSDKTIKALGGSFDREFYYQPIKRFIKNYTINVDESIKKYEKEYNIKTLSLKK